MDKREPLAFEIQHQALAAAAARHGDRFFVFHWQRLQNNFLRFASALQELVPGSQVAYSYKANYLIPYCRWVCQQGGLAEVASSLEYDLARRLGVPGEQIIFNGPVKTTVDLQRAFHEGALVHLESLGQVRAACQLAQQLPGPVPVGLRLRWQRHETPASRFGLDLDSGEFTEALHLLQRSPRLVPIALHHHAISRHRSVEDYQQVALRLLRVAREHRIGQQRGETVLNVGGGFFSAMSPELAAQFGTTTPTLEQYAQGLGETVRKHWDLPWKAKLVVEPGMALVADTAVLVARVMELRHAGPHHDAVLGASRWDLAPTGHGRVMPARVIPCPEGNPQAGPWRLVGNSCAEDDLLRARWEGELAEGDFMVFENVGAYSLILRPAFLWGVPAVLCLREDGKLTLWRRADSAEDWLRDWEVEND